MVEEWSVVCKLVNEPIAAALHIDTGMNRLGIGPDQLVHFFDKQGSYLKNIKLDLIMSHLACADDPAHPRNQRQLKLFREALDKLPPARASLANSAGIFLGPDYHFDLVRPGIALYGGQAVNNVANPMRYVVKLVSHIAQIRTVETGDAIGYGASYTTKRKTRLATVPVGYGDGYLRALGTSNKSTYKRGVAYVCIAGHKAPLIGRVSMDLITVDVTDVPDKLCTVGTPVELLGAHVSVDDLADVAGTIGYEILTSLGARYERSYGDK
jgi:alanine racemase